ncbi:MAG TPA: DUF1232 domain-containing protein [Acetobacteraceae bacterium]|nr:DUF1232 domain-containing protein [Acetobacteraceae bacterium]
MLVFCHCPKTAGTSLFRAISTIHGVKHSYLAKRERPSVAALRARGVTFVAGHVSYEHYAGQADAAGPDGLQFITFFRDPIQLTLSLYQHCTQHRHIWRPATRFFDVELPSRGIAKSEPQAVRLFLARCNELTGIRWDNFQVRFAVDKSAGELDRSDLEAARRNLAAMDVVGITEYFEESLRVIAARFGWQSIEYSRYGAAPDESLPLPDADLLQEIEARCAMDRELVAWARDRFETQLATACTACTRLTAAAPSVIYSAAHRRFSIGWVRAWIALARTWTRDDWRWWGEIKAMALGNNVWHRWRSIRDTRSFTEQLRILVTALVDWRTGFLAKACLIGGGVLPFMPFDLIPNRIPIVGHLDDAGYVLGGLLLARLMVPPEASARPPAREADGPNQSRHQMSQSGTGRVFERRNSGLNNFD